MKPLMCEDDFNAFKLNLRYDFYQNLSKFHILHNWCLQVFTFFRLILVAPATNVISKPFLWSVLSRSRKTCLALQCIRVAVYRTNFFIKVHLFSTNVNWNPNKNVFLGNFWQYYYHYCTFNDCQQRRVWPN